MKNLEIVVDFAEIICQDRDVAEEDGRLVDFISGLVTEEKENFEKYEAAGVILDKNETETICSNALAELTAEFLNAGFAVGYVLGKTDIKNGHLPEAMRRMLGEIKGRLIQGRVLDPDVLPANRSKF